MGVAAHVDPAVDAAAEKGPAQCRRLIGIVVGIAAAQIDLELVPRPVRLRAQFGRDRIDGGAYPGRRLPGIGVVSGDQVERGKPIEWAHTDAERGVRVVGSTCALRLGGGLRIGPICGGCHGRRLRIGAGVAAGARAGAGAVQRRNGLLIRRLRQGLRHAGRDGLHARRRARRVAGRARSCGCWSNRSRCGRRRRLPARTRRLRAPAPKARGSSAGSAADCACRSAVAAPADRHNRASRWRSAPALVRRPTTAKRPRPSMRGAASRSLGNRSAARPLSSLLKGAARPRANAHAPAPPAGSG